MATIGLIELPVAFKPHFANTFSLGDILLKSFHILFMDSKLLELALMFIFSGILSLTVNKIINIKDENLLQKSKWPADHNKLN